MFQVIVQSAHKRKNDKNKFSTWLNSDDFENQDIATLQQYLIQDGFYLEIEKKLPKKMGTR